MKIEALLANRKYATIGVVETEELDTFETTYNFEVENDHTYFVGTTSILVHNACNSNGKKRCQAHQDKIKNIKDELSKNIDEGLEVVTEFRVDTPNGLKSSRYVDVAVTKNKELVKGYQVGVSTKSGIPVSRERKAMKDIAEALGEEIIEFIKYK